MTPRPKSLAIVLLLAGAATLVGAPASAECTRLGFTVNDYGKDGPTKDAKELLDKHIAKTMAERGISKYTVGKKDVSCELFLDLILFDEHTCKAEATVCWGGSQPAGRAPSSAEGAPSAKPAPSASAGKAKATAPTLKPVVETGALPDRAPPADASSEADAAAAAKAAVAADAAERAAAAAERAAAAAERAAAAMASTPASAPPAPVAPPQ
mgnify:CR=1 FL=1